MVDLRDDSNVKIWGSNVKGYTNYRVSVHDIQCNAVLPTYGVTESGSG